MESTGSQESSSFSDPAHPRSAQIHNSPSKDWREAVKSILHVIRCPTGLYPCTNAFLSRYWLDNVTMHFITLGTDVVRWKFTDQVYADDAALFSSDAANWTSALMAFDSAAATMGLHTSWSKTRVQNHQRHLLMLPTNVSSQSTISRILAAT